MFVNEPDPDYFCWVCTDLMMQPFLTDCGHYVCNTCRDELLANQRNECPFCCEPDMLENAILDRYFQRQVTSTKVHCNNYKSEGCKWVGEIKYLQDHHKEDCIFACYFMCGEDVHRCETKDHENHHCLKRPTTCEYCGYHNTYDIVTENHYQVCLRIPINCPNNCTVKELEQCQLQQHLNQCPLQLVQCPCSNTSCSVMLPRKEMVAHTLQQHNLVLEQIINQAVSIAFPPATVSPQYLYNLPPVMFTITDFNDKKEADVMWTSPPFYTHTQGYKFCLQVYPNGDGIGKCSHISVFSCLLQGEYDDDLEWPFEGHFVIELLNNKKDTKHHSVVFTFDRCTDPERICSSRLIGEKKATRFGDSQFILHSLLTYNSTINTEYLQNNCLRLRVSNMVVYSTALLHKIPSWQNPFPADQSVCEFTLTKFSKRREYSKHYYSPPFYTHQQGYKLCLQVCPSGDGSSDGFHIPVFVCLMRGEHDELLQWPLKGEIIIEVINWREDKKHCKMAMSINTNNGFFRVIENVYGKVCFCSYISCSSLPYNPTTNTEYLQEDCLRFRVTCNMVGIACPFGCGKYCHRDEMRRHKKHHCFERLTTCQYFGYHKTHDIAIEKHYPACLRFPIGCPNNCTVKELKWFGQRCQLQQRLNECPLQLVECPCNNTGCLVQLPCKEMATHTLRQPNQELKQIIRQAVATTPPPGTTGPEYLSNLPPVVFTITDILGRKQADEVWTSPPCYTNLRGYKLCLKVYPNGDGSGKGTHISVYACLMRGEYDSELEWPFEGAVSVQLCNWREDTNHHSKTFHFNRYTDKDGICTHRVTDKDNAAACGDQKFIANTDFSHNSTINTEYLQDDCLQLRVNDVVVFSTALLHKTPSWQDSITTTQSVCEFTITKFSKRRKINHRYKSIPFYTHPQGYKLCLQVYAKESIGEGTYVAVFATIMRGEHDQHLQWPFTCSIIFELLNWRENNGHHHRIRFINGFVRAKNMHGMSTGFFDFISCSSLPYNPATNTEYLQEDCLRLRVMVGIACPFGCGCYFSYGHEMMELKKHHCIKWPTTCEYCGYHNTFDIVTADHYPICLRFPIDCPNNCTVKEMERCQLQQHLNQCPLQLVECPCSNTGCSVKLSRIEMAAHTLQQHNQVLGQIINQAVSIASPDLDAIGPQYLYNLPPVVFTITDFNDKKEADVMWTSPPFYTHTQGYKFCLQVYPNGDGIGKCSHISVFACLLQGEYDNDLGWPFEGHFVIELLNNKKDTEHHSVVLTLDRYTDPESICSSRLIGEEKATRFGDSQFILHSLLTYNSTFNTEYLQNDCLRIRVSDMIVYSTALLHKIPAWQNPFTVNQSVCCEFTLTEFSRRRKYNKHYYSPPFYTHQQGYKLCLQVCPSGDGSSDGFHIPVFVCLMRGEHDELLQWPLKGEIIIEVINWREDKKHCKMAMSINTNNGFFRVIENVYGKVCFCSYISCSSLPYNPTTNTEYLQEDCLRFRVTCNMIGIACPFGCGKHCHRDEMRRHKKHYCLKRPTTCEYCGYHKTHDIVTEKHYPVCLQFPIGCPNNCTVKELKWFGKRCQLQQHLNECPLQLVKCPCSNTGCLVQLPRKKMVAHTLQQHNLVLEQIISQAVAITPPSMSPEYLYNLPPVMFTITDFLGKKQADEVWTSPPLYTHARGYKFYLKVYPNGDGIGKGTHISVYACLMRGDYDSELEWPFEGAVTVELCNWREDKNHHSKIFHFNRYTDKDGICTHRFTEKDNATGCGFHKFIANADITHNSTINTEYLQDDCLQLRVNDVVVFSTALLHKTPSWQDSFTTAQSVCEFTITEFSKRRQLNHRYISPPFYTHPQGYKLCLQVYASGCSGEGTHVSVFATIMRGEHDQHLQWPFTCSIIFELLNWREDNGHHQMIRSINVHTGFVRVRNVYGMSNGFFDFILRSSLSYNPTTNTEYLHEDCLRLRVMVGIACPFGCGYYFSYGHEMMELKEHQCTKWPTTCKYCGYHNMLDIITEKHYPICLQFPIDCPNNCTVKEMERCQVQHHLNECPLQLVECPYSNTGCSVQLPREEIAAHMVRKHNQVLEEITNQAVAITPSPGTTSPEYLYNLPPAVFTMTDFLEKKQADEVWTSPPCYTHMRGYKFCLEVFPNGNRSGKGSHISIYALLMRGGYDDELEWPFCDGDISVELRNWKEDRKHYQRTINLNKFAAQDAEMTSDVSAMENSISYGNPEFITHANLTHSISTNAEYVYGNCLRLKVDVIMYSVDLFHKIPSWQDHFTTIQSVCEFTLTDFSKRKQFNNQYISPPFYTHPKGYKLCLLVYCNGYGSSEGSHVSMFIMIMKGKNDQHLQWPFTGNIVLELLNWREDKTHHRMIISISELHQVTGRSYGSYCGFYQIITHSSLQYNATTNTEYLQEDCLRFRVCDVVINCIQKAPFWQDPFSTFQSVCEFKLTEFSKHKQLNNRYYSPPFYTHLYGYKLCLIVYANGYGSGEGSHVSVLITLMEGEHDQHLKWPFTGDLNIELLNWKMNQRHYKRTIQINANHNFVRATVIGIKYGMSYGITQFIAHSSLSFNQTANIEYLQDDCLQLRVSCNWVNIPCSFNCGEYYRIKPAMKLHMKYHCLRRPTTCEYCGYHNTYDIVTEKHYPVCLWFPIDCPKNCMVKKLKRYQLQQHLNECPLHLVECPCSNTGCSVQLPHKEMAVHTLQQHNHVLEQIMNQAVAITPPLATVGPQYLYNLPPVVFTITDFFEKKQANKVWTSPPFYTQARGYKFCLELYANGIESCKGTYVSVFARLLQGEYDDELQWPFEGDLWIELLDNKKNIKHHLKILHFNRYLDPFNRCTSRLIAKNMARSSGYSLFISHSSLSYSPTTNTGYLQDDCLRLRVSDVVVYSTPLLHKTTSWQDPLMTNQSAWEFTLTEFSKRKHFNNKYISPPFYTHPQGYKLCIQVDSKEIANRMDSYVIIYICLMKGEHDQLLQWPFTGEVTITLLNWKKNQGHYKKKITIKAEHGFDRVTERIYGKIYGYQLISISSLSYNSISNTEYLQDDCLRLVVSVGIACTFGCGQYCCPGHEMRMHMNQVTNHM